MNGHLMIDGVRYHFYPRDHVGDADTHGYRVTKGTFDETVGWVAWCYGDRDVAGKPTNLSSRWLAWDAASQPVAGDRPWGRFRTRADAVRGIRRQQANHE